MTTLDAILSMPDADFAAAVAEEVCRKFNAVSDRVGSGIKLPAPAAAEREEETGGKAC